jgi:hypothetical protein
VGLPPERPWPLLSRRARPNWRIEEYPPHSKSNKNQKQPPPIKPAARHRYCNLRRVVFLLAGAVVVITPLAASRGFLLIVPPFSAPRRLILLIVRRYGSRAAHRPHRRFGSRPILLIVPARLDRRRRALPTDAPPTARFRLDDRLLPPRSPHRHDVRLVVCDRGLPRGNRRSTFDGVLGIGTAPASGAFAVFPAARPDLAFPVAKFYEIVMGMASPQRRVTNLSQLSINKRIGSENN